MSKHKPRTVSFIKLWDEIFYTMLSKNDSELGEIRHAPYYMDLRGFYSGTENVTYLYSIDGYPSELELSYRTAIRHECAAGTRISFVSLLEKYQIPWDSPQMKAKFKTWQMIELDKSKIDEYNKHDNLALIDSQTWRRESLSYLSEAEIRRRRKTFRFRSMMFISGKRGDDFDNTVKSVEKACRNMNIKITRVLLNVQDFLSMFSPFALKYNDKAFKSVGNNVITDELIARFNTYSQGTVGIKGIYWGTDIYSHFPCLKPVKRTTETAENWLITAETGGGKSFFVKTLLLPMLANRNINGTIMDVEGFEYLPLGNFMSAKSDVVVINMAEGTGAYFDPVSIILTGDPDLDKDMFSLSRSFTLSMFKVLLGKVEDHNEWIDIILNDIVSVTYTRAGVSEDDMSTWHNAESLTIRDVYDSLKSLLVSGGNIERAVAGAYKQSIYDELQGHGTRMDENTVLRLVTSNEEYQKGIELCIAKIQRYFEKNGTRASVFKNRVTVEQIAYAKLVICSFGMAGKSQTAVDPIQMSLMQLCAANISHIRSVFSKHSGKFNFKLWEEFQRWGKFPDAEKTISTALTGGRKLGDINIIITNAVKQLLDDDKFDVFQNTTTIAIGCIWDSKVRHELCSRLSILNMERELELLVQKNQDLKDYKEGDTLTDNQYRRAFLIGLDRTVYTLARMELPEKLAQSDLFRTGINLANAKNVI